MNVYFLPTHNSKIKDCFCSCHPSKAPVALVNAHLFWNILFLLLNHIVFLLYAHFHLSCVLTLTLLISGMVSNASCKYGEVHMEMKNMERASFTDWEERTEKKDLACVYSFVKMTETEKRPTPAELQGYVLQIYVLLLLPTFHCSPAVFSKSPPVLRVALVMGGYATSSTRIVVTERGKDTKDQCQLQTGRKVLLHFLQAESNATERWVVLFNKTIAKKGYRNAWNFPCPSTISPSARKATCYSIWGASSLAATQLHFFMTQPSVSCINNSPYHTVYSFAQHEWR